MGFPKCYFKSEPGAPPPLVALTQRRVRFEEVDLMKIAWHGRYVSYLEDGRHAFGERYGLSYKAFMENKIVVPIVQCHLDYSRPLRFNDLFTIETKLHWCDALRLNFEYVLQCEDGQQVTRAYTVQLLTDFKGQTQLVPSPFIEQFRDRWKLGAFS